MYVRLVHRLRTTPAPSAAAFTRRSMKQVEDRVRCFVAFELRYPQNRIHRKLVKEVIQYTEKARKKH